MRFCYVDEAGCTGALDSATSSVQPVFIPSAVVFEQNRLRDLTEDFLQIKKRYFPSLFGRGSLHLDSILREIKGADIRRQLRSESHRKRTHAIGFLDRLVELLETHDAKIIGRVWVKGVGKILNSRSLYTYSIQKICSYFQNLLLEATDTGLVIADSRSKPQNAVVSHSIFTQKFTARGDSYSQILEMPTYGHSENHAGLQIADLICSALLFPLATYSYCTGHIKSLHVQPSYSIIKTRFGPRLRDLQHRYRDSRGLMQGGITVCDNLGHRGSAVLFHIAANPLVASKVPVSSTYARPEAEPF